MSDVLIPASELNFLLWDWLRTGALLARAGEDGHDQQTLEAVLDLSADLAERTFLPHFKQADQHEPSLDANGQVHVLPAIVEALREYAALGLPGAGFAPDLGGMGLPSVVVSASLAQFMAASLATSAYPMLTMGNARLIATFGTPAQIEAFAKPQIGGSALGTMCLSEPQAGSGLGDIRTRAEPDGEDALGRRYRLSGNKMWISGGDHDITRDIVHLVLAKIPGVNGALPDGTRGISLFIVPKWLPDSDERNDVSVAGLNHKMGYRGTVNCLLNFGEGERRPLGAPGAVGWLIGAEGQGLQLMFQMMNEARINVGLGAAAVAYRGYRHALGYARERVQGRPLVKGAFDTDPVAIIEHPDVQRMLLAQKAYAEGALALVLYCSKLVDEEQGDPAAAELLALLTPVAKTWPSEWGLAANDLAIQVHGGYGYTRDFDVEQLYRDNRLNPIHEGTTGIQALDLLGRKILRGDGAGMDELGRRLHDTAQRAATSEATAAWAAGILHAWLELQKAIGELRTAEPARALANATSFLRAFGHIVVAWLWLDVALAANAGQDRSLAAGKHRACLYFHECELPQALVWLSFARSLSDVSMGVPLDAF